MGDKPEQAIELHRNSNKKEIIEKILKSDRKSGFQGKTGIYTGKFLHPETP